MKARVRDPPTYSYSISYTDQSTLVSNTTNYVRTNQCTCLPTYILGQMLSSAN